MEIVEGEVVSNQRALVDLLAARGLRATQATISRDIKRLGLIKRPARRGGYRYSVPESALPASRRGESQLRSACEQFVTKIDSGASLLILKTLSGSANAVAVAIDECGLPEVVGTLAGDDTILVIARDDGDRSRLRSILEEMVG